MSCPRPGTDHPVATATVTTANVHRAIIVVGAYRESSLLGLVANSTYW